MALPTYYAGPGAIYYTIPGSSTVVGLQPRDANGQITMSLDEKTTTIGAAQFGDLFETLDDQLVKITTDPFDSWSLLPALFPSYLGVTTLGSGGATGSLAIGTMPHDPTNSGSSYASGVWTSDGRLYNLVRAAITKHPEMKFGPGEKLYGGVEITGLGQLAIGGNVAWPGVEGFIMSSAPSSPVSNPITESGGANPNTSGFTVTAADFGQSSWSGNWGTIFTNLQAEDSWTLSCDVKYNVITVQKLTRIVKLASARFMIKGRLVGPTHTSLLAKILGTSGGNPPTPGNGHLLGGILTEFAGGAFAPADFVLTNAAGTRSVTLKNCEVRGAPFEFGGTKLNMGEVSFVQSLIPSAGSVVPSLVFSA